VRRSAVVLVVWTVFVWAGRIRNGGSILLAASFLVLAAFVVASFWKRQWRPPTVTALVVWTIGVWAIRTPMILVHDHPAGFKIVHSVLAAVSIGLAVWAELDVQRQRQAPASAAGLEELADR
jgi:xanthine/uracil permease